MQMQKIGSRGMLFTFEDQISVYRIRGRQRCFLCDTHLGSLSMAVVKPGMRDAGMTEPVVFNTHSDWDHVWGNCAFPGALLVGHAACRSRLAERGTYELTEMAGYRRGTVELRLPEVIFDSRLAFAADDVEFFHAPGHTRDSSVCHDREDSVLFMGDLVEAPIPYLDDEDLPRYLQTLEMLRQFPARTKITAHSGVVDTELIEANMRYVEQMLSGKPIPAEVYRGAESVQRFNRNNRLLLPLEKLARERQEDTWNYGVFHRCFSDLKQVDEVVLQREIERYQQQNDV
ncbi:MAG TPA: MBL fold metallo-hydrolase [Patescibacteria group bacterium]|nr:MBL fold metallo-hydrolase [Patescibacteria group bacterium]